MENLLDALWSEVLLLLGSSFCGLILSLAFGPESILWCIWICAIVFHVITVIYYSIQEAWMNRKAHHNKDKYYSRYIH